MPAGRVLILMLVMLLVWTLLYAPVLERASRAQPIGTRRTVSLWVLSPLASLSRATQLSRIADTVSRALGRDPEGAPGGVIAPEPEPLPTVTGAPTSSPTPTEPVLVNTPIRKPSPSDKLRVVIVGDSLAAGLGVYVEREFRPALSRVVRQGQISTGLARPDYFNWMAAMRDIMDAFHPDLVIVMLGSNDNQPLQTPGGETDTSIGTFEWPKAYSDRVDQFARIAVDGGAHVVWVGLPIVKEEARWPVMRRQNEIYEAVVATMPNAEYVDTWDRFATATGAYSPFLWEGGSPTLVRATDGFHFNGTGYDIVAADAITEAVEEFDLTPRVAGRD